MFDHFLRPNYRAGISRPPLVYISFGMTKCGSTLAFQFTRRLLVANGIRQERLSNDLIGPEPVENYIDEFSKNRTNMLAREAEAAGGPIVIKTHAPLSAPVRDLFRQDQAVGQAVYRDPREMALSMLDHGKKTRALGRPNFAQFVVLRDTIETIIEQIGLLSGWLRTPNVMPYYYDDFAWGDKQVLEPITRQMLLEKAPEHLTERVKATRFTQLNKAIPQRWRSEMTQTESQAFQEIFAPFYRKLVKRRRWLSNPVLSDRDVLFDRKAADKWLSQL